MWPALIRGSVSSSIRSSSPLPSDKPSETGFPSSENEPTEPTSSNNGHIMDPSDAHANHSPPSETHYQRKNSNTRYDSYNLNNWMNKGITDSLDHAKDESLPSTLDNNSKLDTPPLSQSLRASRSLLAIAASRPSYHLDRSAVLIGSGEPIKPDDDDDNDDSDIDNDDTNPKNSNDGDEDEEDGGDDMNGTIDEYKDTIIETTDDNNSNQWNDKKHPRQATIITIPSRGSKRPLHAITTAASTKKQPKQQQKPPTAEPPKPVATATAAVTATTTTIDKPKKKRKWENVSPPSSPNKKNYEVSIATLASPPIKRKPSGSDLPRPHACPLCDRRFNRRYNLTAHIRVHDPDRKKLFDCPRCNQSFDRKHDRDRHADALHFEHKHRCYCHLCDASFTRRDALTRHVHKLHTQAQQITTSASTSSSSTTTTS